MKTTSRTDTTHAADRLVDAVDRLAAPVCVGLDPVLERMPDRPVAAGADAAVEAIRSFSMRILDAVAAHVPCVKLQSACFERYGHAGVAALERLIVEARRRDLVVILDAKRGDIGVSAAHYAAAAFAPGRAADWVTVNAYFGDDGLRPFLEAGGGCFALVRTSNPGGDAVQAERLADGRCVFEAVATMVARAGSGFVGERGYSNLGAVVGATKREDAGRLRTLMPQQIFLVPGYGAQGGGVDDVRPCFDAAGRGAIVTASRSVIYADPAGGRWEDAVSDAAKRLASEVGTAAGLR